MSFLAPCRFLDEEQWGRLSQFLKQKSYSDTAANVVKHLRALGARSFAVETPYIDRDFSEEYLGFYGKLFRPYHRRCHRIHFFSEDVRPLLGFGVEDAVPQLEALSKAGGYLGYVVLRPLPEAPIGRTVLAAPKSSQAEAVEHTVRAQYTAHFLGASLSVVGTPCIEQDSRIGVCAHAAIWTCARHLHAKHRGPWASVVQIAKAAARPVENSRATSSYRAGLSGLSTESQLAALHAIDRQPYVYLRDEATGKWPGDIDPAAIISRYTDSGLPVIVGLAPWAKGLNAGHAVVVSGYVMNGKNQGGLSKGIARFISHFLVNDDQRGPYQRLPVVNVAGDTPYNISHVRKIIVPLPEKVFVTAERANVFSIKLLDLYRAGWAEVVAKTPDVVQGSEVDAAKLLDEAKAAQLVVRTYLTHGWKHKKRIAQSNCSSVLKDKALGLELPKLVWVTEFGLSGSMGDLDVNNRQILGHAVLDATAARWQGSWLFFHAPGMVKQWSYKDDGTAYDSVLYIKNDQAYSLRQHNR